MHITVNLIWDGRIETWVNNINPPFNLFHSFPKIFSLVKIKMLGLCFRNTRDNN